MLGDHPCGIANPKAAIALLELRYYIAQITTILKEFNVALLDVLRLVFFIFFRCMDADFELCELQQHKDQWITVTKQPNVPHCDKWLPECASPRRQSDSCW
jgi:hypothetical protein